jgi:hypothetical protein
MFNILFTLFIPNPNIWPLLFCTKERKYPVETSAMLDKVAMIVGVIL